MVAPRFATLIALTASLALVGCRHMSAKSIGKDLSSGIKKAGKDVAREVKANAPEAKDVLIGAAGAVLVGAAVMEYSASGPSGDQASVAPDPVIWIDSQSGQTWKLVAAPTTAHAAQPACDGFNGQMKWRLPTDKELRAALDRQVVREQHSYWLARQGTGNECAMLPQDPTSASVTADCGQLHRVVCTSP